MARVDEMIAFLDELLAPGAFSDYGPNGLQVPGPAEAATVVTGVSAGAELFTRAAEHDAGLVLVHHGLFWKGAPLALDAPAKRRLQLLFEHDMALAAYHLPLDGHPEHGNNALLARALGCESWEPFAHEAGAAIGVAAHFGAAGVPRETLIERTREATGGREPLCFPAGPDPVRTIGIVSGGGAPFLGAAIAAGLDAFLTGEPAERVMLQAREAGITFLAGGHYATETLGVRRLGDLLGERFGVRHVFVDVPNPI
ncbi:MAG: Nif3-like dinuclear metal center hexameric protein [Solirubrobacteraceae bacterium]|jgi:dinuclear metal center YbgI/SA1388 family protein|nr:Nif3-like dinuclear metal center hexameric protein [Solirubrobacteraceae bacterium]